MPFDGALHGLLFNAPHRPIGTGGDFDDVGQLLQLSDTFRLEILHLVNATDGAVEQPSAKPSMQKTLYECVQQKQTSLVQLENQIRNLRDLEDHTNKYEEWVVYLAIILRTICCFVSNYRKIATSATTRKTAKTNLSGDPSKPSLKLHPSERHARFHPALQLPLTNF